MGKKLRIKREVPTAFGLLGLCVAAAPRMNGKKGSYQYFFGLSRLGAPVRSSGGFFAKKALRVTDEFAKSALRFLEFGGGDS